LIQIELARPPQQTPAPHQIFLLGDIPMMDVIMIAIGVVFFALSIGYVYACDRL
jgi:hypothetical protein